MNMKRLISATALCLTLCACGNGDSFRDSMGLNRKGPDEFQVYTRPPLTVPPDYNLPVPKNGAEYAIGAPADEQAHNIVAGKRPLPVPATAVQPVTSGALFNSADSQFLNKAGASNPDKKIRQTITSDNGSDVGPKDGHYLITPSGGADPTVDAQKEAERLKKNKSQNQSPTAGETPVNEPSGKGILGDLF